MPEHRHETIRARRDIWESATAYIAAHLVESIDLDDLARASFSSRRQVQRVFAEVGDTTVRAHIHRVRMQAAAEQLAWRHLTVREVAKAVGYSQPAQFAKAFRRCYGVAPSEWRADAEP